MDWDRYVDSYCERVAPGLFGEPLNATSNLAFLLGAVLLWLSTRAAAAGAPGRPRAATLYALPILITLIFLGSTAFHTTATRWGGALDTGFIVVFLLYYVVFFAHWFLGVRWSRAWLAAPAFAAFTALVTATVGQLIGSGPGMYLSALLGLFVFAAMLRWWPRPEVRSYWVFFAVAGAVFALSLTLRGLDRDVCDAMPAGTHFLWHVLNACTLYLVSRAAINRWRARVSRPPVDAPTVTG